MFEILHRDLKNKNSERIEFKSFSKKKMILDFKIISQIAYQYEV